MKKTLDWLTRFFWISEIIFLVASAVPVATYFVHFERSINVTLVFLIGCGLALFIEGMSFLVLLSIQFSIRYHRPKWSIALLVVAFILVSLYIGFIDWQYSLVFA